MCAAGVGGGSGGGMLRRKRRGGPKDGEVVEKKDRKKDRSRESEENFEDNYILSGGSFCLFYLYIFALTYPTSSVVLD